MKIPAPEFTAGENWIVRKDALPWEDPKNPKMDFLILLLPNNKSRDYSQPLEKAFLLMDGAVEFTCKSEGKEEKYHAGPRKSIFDDDPWCLHVPSDTKVTIKNTSSQEKVAEIAIIMTPNEKTFPTSFYTPEQCRSEHRGQGTMRETSTRIVRTIFDKSNAPDANLVLGEVINYPGKWSSYPPHHHPQPEIYHYRFFPEQGFGFSMLGDKAVQVRHGETVAIFDVVHSQTSAPGYAMYYIWPIRHLDENPYGAEYGTPIFQEEHLWVTKKENESKIWPKK